MKITSTPTVTPEMTKQEADWIMMAETMQLNHGFVSAHIYNKIVAINNKYGIATTLVKKDECWPIHGIFRYNHTANYRKFYK